MLGTLILDAVIVIYFIRNILFDEQTPSSKPGYIIEVTNMYLIVETSYLWKRLLIRHRDKCLLMVT